MKDFLAGTIRFILVTIGLLITFAGWLGSIIAVFYFADNGNLTIFNLFLCLIISFSFSAFGGYILYKEEDTFSFDSLIFSIILTVIFRFNFYLFSKSISFVTRGKITFE